MTWNIQPCDPPTYQRNPLVLVVARIDFLPMQNFDERFGEFKEYIEKKLGVHTKALRKHAKISPEEEEVQFWETEEHIFSSEDNETDLLVTNDSLTIRTTKHHSHSETMGEFDLYINKLFEIYKDISVTRIATRYINEIHKQNLEQDLGHELEWSDLINHQFTNNPASLFSKDPASTYGEITSDVVTGGQMTIKYGYRTRDNVPYFYFDLDRFVVFDENQLKDNSLRPEMIKNRLIGFAKDIYCVFSKVAQTKLEDWMGDKI